MPGGYGTSGPWGSAGTSYVSSGQSSSPYQSGAGSTNQGGSNAVADAINEQKYKQSNEYLNNADNFLNPQEQYAATLAAYNKKYGVAGGSVGLGSSGAMYYTDVPDVYYSTYVPGTQGHSPTGYQEITGPGLLSINGVPISGGINRSIYNPHGGGGGGGGGGGHPHLGSGSGSGNYGYGIGRHPLSFYRGRSENIHPYWSNIVGSPMLDVAGSGVGASQAGANYLASLAMGNQAFGMDPGARRILDMLQA